MVPQGARAVRKGDLFRNANIIQMSDYSSLKRRRTCVTYDVDESGDNAGTRVRQNPTIDGRLRGRSSTALELNVGGTKFQVSRTTLTESSSYFEALVSGRWKERERIDEADDVLFIDQDPAAFEILLTYMRCGLVYLPREDLYLSKKTLMLAEYLGINGFLITVKAVTVKNISRRGDYLSDETSEAAQFDSRFGSLRLAVEKEILPLCFFPPEDALRIRVVDRTFYASKAVLTEKSGYFSRWLTSNPKDYWRDEYISGENADVMEVVLQMLTCPNSAFTTMTEKFHSVSGQNVKFRHFYVQAILTYLDKLQLPVDFRDNCVQTITHTFNA
ncbi:hypothetical protein HJC23_005169 [Cyclotella cryptica]|uniref:BTB domain-containing protein n=1 Tax=Cyclotella cryptica TaxID=29204 RepID=A0ABD3QFR4_9STRA|eukprot:CCRYP_005861-RA/>CCRYP_005861-RA protein AED:0.12 eAED:0.13 QI:0/0/0/1/1/1/2/0/329